MPYCFSGSSIKFQCHTGCKIDDLNPIWVTLLGRSQLSNPSDLPCFAYTLFLCPIFRVGLTCTGHAVLIGPKENTLSGVDTKTGMLRTWSWYSIMMTSWNENILRVNGPIWGEFSGHRWIPFAKANNPELWCFLWSAPEQPVVQTVDTSVIWDPIALIMTSL